MNHYYVKNSLKLLFLCLFLLNTGVIYSQEAYPVLEQITENKLDEESKLLGEFDGRLLYFDVIAGQTKLWVSDATPTGTFQIGVSGQEDISLISMEANASYFVEKIADDYHISVLMAGSDNLVSLYNTDENIRHALLWNGSIYYIRESATFSSRDDLVKFDLETATTEILFSSEFGGIRGLGATDTAVMFIASMNEGKMLGKSDGTATNTSTFHMLYPAGSEFGNSVFMKSDGGKMFFAYHPNNDPYNLWVSDGTSSGTMILKEYDNPSFSAPDNPFAFLNGKFYFILRNANAPSGTTFDLHVSDGTVAGTFNLNPDPSNTDHLHPRQLTVFNDKVYFNSLVYNWGLMATDGTVSGTETIIDAYGYQSGGIGQSYDNGLYNGKLIVQAYSNDYGSELYTSDGTLAGTTLLLDVVPGTESSNPSQFIQVGELLFFVSYMAGERYLWVYEPGVNCDDFALDSVLVNNVIGTGLGSIEVQVSGGAEPYAYQLNGGTSTANPLFENLAVGNYTILVTDANGCILEGSADIDVETRILNPHLINAFQVFPNPVILEKLTLEVSFTDYIGKINLEIFDLLGRRVFHQSNIDIIGNKLNYTIPMHDFLSGEYLMLISAKNQKLLTEKFTVIHRN